MKAYIDQIVNDHALLLLGEDPEKVLDIRVKLSDFEGDKSKIQEGNYIDIDLTEYFKKRIEAKEAVDRIEALEKGRPLRFTYDEAYNKKMAERSTEALRRLREK